MLIIIMTTDYNDHNRPTSSNSSDSADSCSIDCNMIY